MHHTLFPPLRRAWRRSTVALCAALPLAAVAVATQAAPVLYTMNFDASNTAAGALGPSGTGSFVFDAAAGLMTGFDWNLGPGLSGGIADAYFLLPAFGLNTGQFMFSNVLQDLVDDPAVSGASTGPPEGSGYYLGSFPSVIAEFCWGISEPGICGMANSGSSLAAYEFIERGGNADVFAYRGYVSITSSAAPEPGSLPLLGLGLAAAGLSNRRRHRVGWSWRSIGCSRSGMGG